MKKTLKIFVMLLFCLCPILLTACEAVDYFSITAMTSDDSLGRVDGYLESKVAGGTEVTLVANSFNDDNPLLCWIKDNETIVSVPKLKPESTVRDNTFKVIASQATEGQYTAIFNEQPASMKYAYVSSYTAKQNGVDIATENTTIDLSYAIMTAGTNNYIPFNIDVAAGTAKVLYFGGLGENFEFKFQATITVKTGTEEQPIETTYTLTCDEIVNKTTFDSQGIDNIELSYKKGTPDEMTVSLQFSKLNEGIFAFVDNAGQPAV